MEFSFEIIRKYLPIFLNVEEKEFVDYLETAFRCNYESKNYQICFLVFHMLYMSFIYKVLWRLYSKNQPGLISLLQNNTYKSLGIVNTPYDFSNIDETPIFKLLQALKFHKNDTDIFAQHVQNRNHCVHSSGKVHYGEVQVTAFINDEVDNTKKISLRIISDNTDTFNALIEENWNKDIRELSTTFDVIGDFINKNKFSEVDMFHILKNGSNILSLESDIGEIFYKKVLLLNFYGYMIFNSDMEEINYSDKFVSNFSSLLNGIPKDKGKEFIAIIDDEFHFIFPLIGESKEKLLRISIDNYFNNI